MRKRQNIHRFINIMYCIYNLGIIPESIIGKGSLGNVTTAIQTALVSKFGWFYIISVSIILGVSIF